MMRELDEELLPFLRQVHILYAAISHIAGGERRPKQGNYESFTACRGPYRREEAAGREGKLATL